MTVGTTTSEVGVVLIALKSASNLKVSFTYSKLVKIQLI